MVRATVFGMAVSKRTMTKFAEVCSSDGTIGGIERLFEAVGFFKPDDWECPDCSKRRATAMAYQNEIDVDDREQERRLLDVYSDGLLDFCTWNNESSKDAKVFIHALRRDGFTVDDNGAITIPAGGAVLLPLERFDRLGDPHVLQEHLDRISNSIASEPATAIGASKSLFESTMKFVLEDYGEPYDNGDDILALYKKVAALLKINADAVPASAKGSQAAHKALRSMSATAQSVAELANELSWRHGKTTRSAAEERHARLTYNATHTVVEFVLDTWHVRREVEQQAVS